MSVLFDTDVDSFVDITAVVLVVFGVVDSSAVVIVVGLVIFDSVLVSDVAVVDVILAFFNGGLLILDVAADSFVDVVDVSFI